MNNGKRTIIIYIDTSSNTEVEVSLNIDGEKDVVRQVLDRKRAQVVLPIIETLLKKHELLPSDLTGIEVHTGPGSFTGLRVGVSIANALGTYLQIPINHLPVGKIVEPVYS